jgi:tRNA threonylcarbamoyladenosine biosynthesis protein TsaE
MEKVFITDSPKKTIELASRLAKSLGKGDVVALVGGLGAGKTIFAKGLAKGLGVADHSHVNSPSFVIMKEYSGKKVDLYHFDVYRLEEENFRDTLDYRSYFYGDGVTVVEWADKIIPELPEEYLEVSLEYKGIEKRKITLRGIGEKYGKIVKRLKTED